MNGRGGGVGCVCVTRPGNESIENCTNRKKKKSSFLNQCLAVEVCNKLCRDGNLKRNVYLLESIRYVYCRWQLYTTY